MDLKRYNLAGVNDDGRLDIPGKLLVRGKVVASPFKDIREFGLHKNILKALETLNIRDLSPLHKIVAPNLLHDSDIIVIASDGSSQCGKNLRALSYTLPIIRKLCDNCSFVTEELFGNKKDPDALIVVDSSRTGANLERHITQLLDGTPNLLVGVKFIARTAPEPSHSSRRKPRLLPGSESITIITIDYFLKVIEHEEGLRHFKKLRFLVFEEFDMYQERYSQAILSFVNAARLQGKILHGGPPLQMTVSARRWIGEMEDLFNVMTKDHPPMVAISAPGQALRYSKMKLKIHYLQKEETRLEALEALLANECLKEHARIVIACSTPENAGLVSCLVSGKDERPANLVQLARQKKRNNVHIISDDMLYKSGVDDATCLIHFDSPQFKGGVRAAERFAYLWSNIPDLSLKNYTSNAFGRPELIAHFLLTGHEHNFEKLYKFAKSFDGDVDFPEELEKPVKTRPDTDNDIFVKDTDSNTDTFPMSLDDPGHVQDFGDENGCTNDDQVSDGDYSMEEVEFSPVESETSECEDAIYMSMVN